MQPFELPEFYLPLVLPAHHPPQPHSARLNPNADKAREHSLEWARQLGIPEVSADYALLTAYTHPDASGDELELLTDWYVWAAAVNEQDQLGAFVPVDPTGAVPEPTNPMQRALVDLCARTVPTMDEDWCRRFAGTTRFLLEKSVWQQGNNPVDYLAVRRRFGPGRWSAILVEHAVGAALPAEVRGTRSMRVLRDAFADGVHLREDLFSCQLDTKGRNGVLVLERFFGYSPQRAADTVNDLITLRLRQFEDVAQAGLPLLFNQLRLGAPARAGIARYVKGLRDWQAGSHEWLRQSSGHAGPPAPRPAGLGPSAARIRALLSRAGAGLLSPARPFATPNLVMPFASRSNPRLDAVRRHALTWAAELGMLAGDVWTEKRFHDMDFGLLAALTYPDAELSELELVNDWQVWAWYLEDLFAETFARTEDLSGAKVFRARLLDFLPFGSDPPPTPMNPAQRGLVELCSRTDTPIADQVTKVVDRRLSDIANLVRRSRPDPVELLELRRADNALSATLVRYVLGSELSSGVLETEPVRTLVDIFDEVVALNGDVVSYPGKLGAAGEVTNTVLVVQRFLDCTLAEAVKVVSDLSSSRLRRFEHIVANELPSVDRHLLSYVDGLRDWLAGHLLWLRVSGRYLRPRVRIPAMRGGPRDRVSG